MLRSGADKTTRCENHTTKKVCIVAIFFIFSSFHPKRDHSRVNVYRDPIARNTCFMPLHWPYLFYRFKYAKQYHFVCRMKCAFAVAEASSHCGECKYWMFFIPHAVRYCRRHTIDQRRWLDRRNRFQSQNSSKQKARNKTNMYLQITSIEKSILCRGRGGGRIKGGSICIHRRSACARPKIVLIFFFQIDTSNSWIHFKLKKK